MSKLRRPSFLCWMVKVLPAALEASRSCLKRLTRGMLHKQTALCIVHISRKTWWLSKQSFQAFDIEGLLVVWDISWSLSISSWLLPNYPRSRLFQKRPIGDSRWCAPRLCSLTFSVVLLEGAEQQLHNKVAILPLDVLPKQPLRNSFSDGGTLGTSKRFTRKKTSWAEIYLNVSVYKNIISL